MGISSTTTVSLSVASFIRSASIRLLVTTVALRHLHADDVNILYIFIVPTTLLLTVYGSCIKATSFPSFSVSSIGLYVTVLERWKFYW